MHPAPTHAQLLMDAGDLSTARAHLEQAAAEAAGDAENEARVHVLVPRLLDLQMRAI